MAKILARTLPNDKGPTTDDLAAFLTNKFNVTKFLFDKQLAFVRDPSPYKIAVCSRRAGKTVACAAHLIDTAINNPGTISIYITLSANNAKKLCWAELKKINRENNLRGAVNETELSIVFPNNAIVYCSGAKDASEIEKFRGLAIKLCYIDECQSFREYIQELIDDIIEPALLDNAGTLCLIGTPSPIPSGYFYECAMNTEAWSKHTWTFWDNPHIATKSGVPHEQLLARVLKRRNIPVTHPSIQREYYGKWEPDTESLLIKYDLLKNDYKTIPPFRTKPHYVMGIDIGFNDADAICILGWYDESPVTFLVEEVIAAKQGITELVAQVNDLRAKYDVSKIVMDTGGLGKKIGEEMIRRYLIPVEAADKTRKMENIELLNDSLRSGRFMAKAKSRFAQDSYLVEIDKDKSTPDKIRVSDRFHSDIIDSVLYAFKLSPAYTWEPPVVKPKYGTKEYADQEHDAMWERELEGHKQADSLKKWLENGEN